MSDDFPPLPPHHRLILVFCMRLFYFVRCWPPAYGNSSSGQKIRAKRGSNPWSRAPTDHTQTTTPLAQFWFWLVWYFLYMLIDVFCGHLISHKKRGDSGGIRTRDTRPHIRAPYHGTTYVIWFWIPCFFFIASMTARLVTRTPRGKFGKKLRQKGGFEPWSQGRDSDALPLPC
jgi:hypothetical protein